MHSEDGEVDEVDAIMRRKRREAGLFGGVTLALLVASGAALWTFVLQPEPAPLLETEAPTLEARIADYCRVRQALSSLDDADDVPDVVLPELRLPVDHDLFGREETPRARDPRTNADLIEQSSLDFLCGARPRSGRRRFVSLLVDLHGLRSARELDARAVAGAMADLRAIEWLLVFRASRAIDARTVSDSEFLGGELEARIWICRLADATCPTAVDVAARSPAVVTYDTYEGFERPGQAQGALDAETARAFRHAVRTAFAGAGHRLRDPAGQLRAAP